MKNVMVLVLVALGVAWGQELVATESYYPHGEVGLRIACPAEGAEWWSTVSTLDEGGTYLTLTCEATALTYHPGFSPEWMAYIVGGLQYDVESFDYLNGSAGEIYPDATVRFVLGLTGITPDHAGEPFRLCYAESCMEIMAPTN